MVLRPFAVAILTILAGCASQAPPESPVAQESGSSPDLPGVTSSGFHNVTGRFHTIDLVARNTGLRTYGVYTSQSGAWTDSVRGPDGEVTIRNDAYTQECGWKAFRPGDVLRDGLAWDGTLYQGQDAQGRDHPTKPAPPGHYVWTVRLIAWNEDRGTCPDLENPPSSIDLTFDVIL